MKAAQQQATWAKLTFFIGFAGTAAIVVTLIFTAKAARAAQTAADATVSSVQVANRSAEAAEKAAYVERAWLCFENVEKSFGDRMSYNGHMFATGQKFTVQWKNSGRTPAVETRVMARKVLLPVESSIIPEFKAEFKAARYGAAVGPGAIFQASGVVIGDDDLRHVLCNTHMLLLYSAVRYRDTFTETMRFSEVCLRVVNSRSRLVGTLREMCENATWDQQAYGPQNTAN